MYLSCLPSRCQLLLYIALREFPYGLAVRDPGFHPGGPGSTPGMGNSDFFIHQVALLDVLF